MILVLIYSQKLSFPVRLGSFVRVPFWAYLFFYSWVYDGHGKFMSELYFIKVIFKNTFYESLQL